MHIFCLTAEHKGHLACVNYAAYMIDEVSCIFKIKHSFIAENAKKHIKEKSPQCLLMPNNMILISTIPLCSQGRSVSIAMGYGLDS
jgi:hypothetical protein